MGDMDKRCKELLDLLAKEKHVGCDDERLSKFSDDRGSDTDTINIMIAAGRIKQTGNPCLDAFQLEFIV